MLKNDRKATQEAQVELFEDPHRTIRKPEKRSDGGELPLETVSRCPNDRYRHKQQPGERQQNVDWVEVTPLEQASSSIEVNIGMYMVRVCQGFDRGAFADVCRTLKELC